MLQKLKAILNSIPDSELANYKLIVSDSELASMLLENNNICLYSENDRKQIADFMESVNKDNNMRLSEE